MSRRAIMIGVFAFVLIMSWNSLMLLNWKSPSELIGSSAATAPEQQLWQDIKKTTIDNSDDGLIPTFDEAVTSIEGNRVELRGVGFLLKSGVEENDDGEKKVTEFMLLPGHDGVAWCCGLTPIAEVKYSVLVDCKDASFPIEKADPASSSMFVNVSGNLRLQTDNSIDAIYTLENAVVEFIDIADVLPANVMNQCLNQPMIQ